MKIILLVVGKTVEKYLEEGIGLYADRLKHYNPFQLQVIPELRNAKHLSVGEQKTKEAELILKEIQKNDFVVLLDEAGKQMGSVEFSNFLQKCLNQSVQRMVMIVGGPYGVDEKIKSRAQTTLSFSEMTFSHQMIRLFVTEQIYRAFTILRNEPYHHV